MPTSAAYQARLFEVLLELFRRLSEERPLVADQLFMAESTAGVHVSNILGKLGVRRRHEAKMLAQRMGLGGP